MKPTKTIRRHISSGGLMMLLLITVVLGTGATAGLTATVAGAPPYDGTAFIDPDIVTPADPTTLEGIQYTGRGLRTVFDRRVGAFIEIDAYLFSVWFDDGLDTEFQVNPEFGSRRAAAREATALARPIGQLMTSLRAGVDAVWVHKGNRDFGGGNDALLVYTGRAAKYAHDGFLEEVLIHEASHTSLDPAHASAPDWLEAQSLDAGFISLYAQDHPTTEDVAESFIIYIALFYKPDRVSSQDLGTMIGTIPRRLEYFDSQGFNFYPMTPTVVARSTAADDGWIRESAARTGQGGHVDAGGAELRVGDDRANRRFRSILSLNTFVIPDDAQVKRIQLRVKLNGVTGKGNPIKQGGGLMVSVAERFQATRLQRSDFQSAAPVTLGPFQPRLVDGWYLLNLTQAKAWFSKFAQTQLRLRFMKPTDGNDHANALELFSGDAAVNKRPLLSVRYTIRPQPPD